MSERYAGCPLMGYREDNANASYTLLFCGHYIYSVSLGCKSAPLHIEPSLVVEGSIVLSYSQAHVLIRFITDFADIERLIYEARHRGFYSPFAPLFQVVELSAESKALSNEDD